MRSAVGVAAAALGLALVPAATASAVDSERAGWWNRLSAGALAAPAPTNAAGDLRVAGSGETPTAYSAVLFRVPGATDATLDLLVRPGSVVGTVEVLACPTKDETWEEGENQPYDQAPAYDCERASAFGSLSEDGTTLSFALDSSTQLTPGTWSLALVPQPDGTAPFAVDLEQPGPAALTAAASDSGQPVIDPAGPAAEPPVTGDGAATADAPLLTGSLDVPPPVDLGTAEAPLLAGGVEALVPEAPAAPAPDVAPVTGAAAPPVAFRPVLAARDTGSASRLLALLVLVGGSVAVGYAAGQGRTEPRLLGGRARSAAPSRDPVQETAPTERPRGIGRFARERDAAPRRLR